MTRKKILVTLLLLACLLGIQACNLNQPGDGLQTPTAVPSGATPVVAATVGVKPNTPVPSVTATIKKDTPLPTLTPTRKAPNPNPVGIRQGLASLNTYRLTIKVKTSGPGAADRSENTTLYEVNTPKDSLHVRTETLSSSADSPNSEASVSDLYQVGNQSCSVSKSGAELKGTLSDVNPLQNDMSSTLTGLVDFNIYTENPVFVAEETVNGILSNHFTFKVTQLGKDSGGVVGKNSGDYWVAKDGQYLVKYALVLDLTSAAQNKTPAQTMHSELAIELSGANQAVEIAIPTVCKRKATP